VPSYRKIPSSVLDFCCLGAIILKSMDVRTKFVRTGNGRPDVHQNLTKSRYCHKEHLCQVIANFLPASRTYAVHKQLYWKVWLSGQNSTGQGTGQSDGHQNLTKSRYCHKEHLCQVIEKVLQAFWTYAVLKQLWTDWQTGGHTDGRTPSPHNYTPSTGNNDSDQRLHNSRMHKLGCDFKINTCSA